MQGQSIYLYTYIAGSGIQMTVMSGRRINHQREGKLHEQVRKIEGEVIKQVKVCSYVVIKYMVWRRDGPLTLLWWERLCGLVVIRR
jgi:hypothetical protein